jgi:hypothetical protein
MKKEQLLAKLERAWTGLQASYAGLTDAQLTQPGATGDWSVKDIIVHVTAWEQEALKYLPVILEGGRPPRYSVTYGGIDAFNAKTTAGKHAMSLADVLREMEETHGQLVAYVEGAPEEQLLRETRFRRRLRLDTYSHYAEHEKAIRAWRERGATGAQA